MKNKLLHIIFLFMFLLSASIAFAQPANLPAWESGGDAPLAPEGAPDSGFSEDYDIVLYNLPVMSILDIEGSAPSLTLATSGEAGTALNSASSNNSWINYTSIIQSGSTYKITAAITGGTVPTGTELKTTAATYNGAGNGTFGVPTNEITLVSFAQDLVTGIGSSYTNDGVGNGHRLTYNWSIVNGSYESLEATSGSDIVVTYTITAE